MKFNPILLAVSITTLPAFATFSFGSCSLLNSCSTNKAKDPITETAAEEYIHDRSFSLLGSGISGTKRYMAWGTAWIISDATPAKYNDYEYYIATNWHVVLGHQEVESKTSDYHVYFGDDTKSSGLKVLSDYTQFTSYTLEDKSNFYYDSPYSSYCIDFYVAKANFESASGSTKTKLNKLNALQQEKGYITQFAPATTDSKQYMTDTMYVAGFPVKNSYYATWETHQFKPTNVGMEYYGINTRQHGIDDKDILLDISPQYVFGSDVGTNWMTGGASGSMLLGKFDNEYKVCGIYWGGWTNSSKTVFYPSFSIFKSATKDFVSKY